MHTRIHGAGAHGSNTMEICPSGDDDDNNNNNGDDGEWWWRRWFCVRFVFGSSWWFGKIIGKSTLLQVRPTTNFAKPGAVYLFSVTGVKTFAFIASGVCFRIFISLILIHLYIWARPKHICTCERSEQFHNMYHSFNNSVIIVQQSYDGKVLDIVLYYYMRHEVHEAVVVNRKMGESEWVSEKERKVYWKLKFEAWKRISINDSIW